MGAAAKAEVAGTTGAVMGGEASTVTTSAEATVPTGVMAVAATITIAMMTMTVTTTMTIAMTTGKPAFRRPLVLVLVPMNRNAYKGLPLLTTRQVYSCSLFNWPGMFASWEPIPFRDL